MGQAREVMDKLTDTMVEGADVDSLLSLYAEDAVVTTPDEGEIKGHAQVAEYWRTFIGSFSDIGWEPINKLEADHRAVDEGYFVATNTGALKMPTGATVPATGKRIKMRECDVATVKDGKIVEHHLYFDEADFARQLGLVG